MTCRQGLGSSDDLLLRWLLHSIEHVLNSIHCNIIVIVHNMQIFVKIMGGKYELSL